MKRKHFLIGGISGVLLLLTLAAAFDPNVFYQNSISVSQTNYVAEQVVTNGLTIGGVRNTAWPTLANLGGVAQSSGFSTNQTLVTPTLTTLTVGTTEWTAPKIIDTSTGSVNYALPVNSFFRLIKSGISNPINLIGNGSTNIVVGDLVWISVTYIGTNWYINY